MNTKRICGREKGSRGATYFKKMASIILLEILGAAMIILINIYMGNIRNAILIAKIFGFIIIIVLVVGLSAILFDAKKGGR